MLPITIPETELYDETIGKFVTVPARELRLEHSLVSLQKWEAKWKKPFLTQTEMTVEQTIDYVRCMTITQNVPPITYKCLTNENIEQIRQYINDPMTATWFSENEKKPIGGKGTVLTAEVIYWQMIALEIPQDYKTWHLNQLLTLIHVCANKQKPDKKMSKAATMRRNRNLNAARKARLGTRG